MMSEHAFINTILENPHDDGPRAVYADWLEECGRCNEAQAIRETIVRKRVPSLYNKAKMDDLLGKTIASITGKVGDDEINITLVTGEKYRMYYEPD